MRASAEAVLPLRRRVAEVLGDQMTVAERGIALLHRMHHSGDGACVRCRWVHAGADRIDGAIDMVRASMSELDQVEGVLRGQLVRQTGSRAWR